jgi:hypothetical protein
VGITGGFVGINLSTRGSKNDKEKNADDNPVLLVQGKKGEESKDTNAGE